GAEAQLAPAPGEGAGVDGGGRARGGPGAPRQVGGDVIAGGLDDDRHLAAAIARGRGDRPGLDRGDDRRGAVEDRVFAEEEGLSGRRDDVHERTSARASGPGATTSTAWTPGCSRSRSASGSAASAR